MKKENIVTRKWGDRRKGKTDWARFDALTDDDIAKAVDYLVSAAPYVTGQVIAVDGGRSITI